MQLYSTDPEVMVKAVRRVVDEDLADHIDLNFGCSVKKITSKGGGAAIPWKRRLFGQIVRAAVETAAPAGIPVTIKMRKGIDDNHLTYVEAGLIAQDAGVAWVALHARTANQRYSGTADWDAIATLKQALDVPVLGNGDIWEADDALRMVRDTGCDGVVVGRGCLGRPWLFADLAAAFAGRPERVLPDLGEVAAVMRRHAGLLAEFYPTERDGVTDFRLTIVHDPALHSWTETLAIGAHPDDVDGLLQVKNPHSGALTADNRLTDALGSVMILAPIIGLAVGATDPNSASSYAVLGGTIVGAAAIGASGIVRTEKVTLYGGELRFRQFIPPGDPASFSDAGASRRINDATDDATSGL